MFFDGSELESRYRLKRSKQDLSPSKIPSELVGLDVYKEFAFIPQRGRLSRGGAVAVFRQDGSGFHQVGKLETQSPITQLVRSRSGNLIAAICTNAVALIGLPALEEVLTIRSVGSISSVAISDDDKMLAVGESTTNRAGTEYVINIYDTKTGETRKSLKSPSGYLPSFAFTPDSTRLVAGGAFSEHYIWTLQVGQTPEVLAIDDEESVYYPISGQLVEQRRRLGFRSEAIAFRNDETAVSVLSDYDKLQFVEWENGRQKSAFVFDEPMKFMRTDDNDKGVVYVETPRLPGRQFDRDIDGQLMEHKYKAREIAALDTNTKRFVKRFATTFVPANAQLFDVEPTSGMMIGTEHRDGQLAQIFLANGNTGKINYSVVTPMRYVNDAICLPQGLFIVGGHAIPSEEEIEIVDLKSGTTVKHLENQSLLSFGCCKGFNYLITKDVFPKADTLNFWRLEDGSRFASVPHLGVQRVVISPSEERVASISGDAISVWDIQHLQKQAGLTEARDKTTKQRS